MSLFLIIFGGIRFIVFNSGARVASLGLFNRAELGFERARVLAKEQAIFL